METIPTIGKLKGKCMHYAWGGTRFLPEMLGLPNPDQKPFAEYWMGAHPSAPSDVLMPNGPVSLYTLCKEHPEKMLSEKVYDRFGELPFLFKILDVKDILSIQVHPNKAEAEKGFDREEAAGVPLNAPYRNYKDRNHKPEVMVALSEFWLLHGFRSHTAIEEVLQEVPEFNILQPLFKKEGLQSLYRFVMEMAQPEINAMLGSLIKREIRKKNEGLLSPDMPGWWVSKIFSGKAEKTDIDRAVFSLYFFNIVRVQPGQGIFQGAGVPHAYMEGQCVELMANSDNVLRAGLTNKHIDVPELMKHTIFESIVPAIMNGTEVKNGEYNYPCPVPDFALTRIELSAQRAYEHVSDSLEILIVTEGGALVNNSLVLKRGEAFVAAAGQAYHLQASGNAILFKAFVPQA